MVGRSSPLGRLTDLLANATATSAYRDGRPAVALVGGEAGIGKTRLLTELIEGAPAGTLVLAGQAEPGALGRPFELARSVLGEAPAHAEDAVRAIVEAVETRVGERRTLVVFEDLHWADAESVAVFERLAGLARPSMLLVGTYRPDELTRRVPAAEMLMRLKRRHQVHQLRLDRLRHVDVAAFLAAVYGRALPPTVVDQLYSRTGGNPFFLEELLASETEPERLCASPLPWSLAELVQRQLDGVSREERRVVEAAAVLGRRAPFDLLATMTGCDEDVLIGHLRSLVERGLVVEEREDQFSFRHALVRDAVEQQLLGRERRRLHATALAALRGERSADLAELARHAAGAGAYEELVEIAREGVVHYLASGSTHQALVLALEALPEAPDDLLLLEGAARAAWLVGQSTEALPCARHWEELARLSGDLSAEAAAVRVECRLLHELGREAELWPKVAQLEALNDRLPSGEDRARNLACIAQMHMLSFHPADAVVWAERAVEEADAADAKAVRAQALVERASALAGLPDRFDEGAAAMRLALVEAEAAEDWVLVARGLNNMSMYLPSGSAESAELVARLREASARAGFDVLRAEASFHAARYAIAQGDLATAQSDIDEGLELMPIGAEIKATWMNHVQVFLSTEQGRLAAADAALAECEVPSAGGVSQLHGRDAAEHAGWHAELRLALAAHRGERNLDVGALVGQAAAGARHPHLAETLETVLNTIEAAHLVGLSNADVARLVVAPWRQREDWPEAYHVAVEGVMASLGSRHEEAVPALRAALDDPSLGLPAYRSAALRVALARSLAATGQRSAAHEAARAARVTLDRWPGWRRDEVDTLLRRLHAAAPDDDDLLSRREREVAALLAEGLSNAELARRLYISPKTAAVHVSNILAKLGMSSRAEVAAWAVRTGVAAGTSGSSQRAATTSAD